MSEMNRNLESSILLDESYLEFVEILRTATSKIHRNADETSSFLLDEPSQDTISMILEICEKIKRVADNSEEAVKRHLKKAQNTLNAYNTLL